jgi:hypothetical protein
MFGTRKLFLHAQDISLSSSTEDSPHITFLRRLYQQSKQISQIVAFVWRWTDDMRDDPESQAKRQAAKKLKKYFEHPTTDGVDIDNQLKKLFKVVPDLNGNEEAQLLHVVFGLHQNPNLIFPIFNPFELGEEISKLGYTFIIDFEHYYGEIQDPTKNQPNLLTFKIPYPPRPQLGELTVTHEELDTWANDTRADEYLADNVYIPTSSC